MVHTLSAIDTGVIASIYNSTTCTTCDFKHLRFQIGRNHLSPDGALAVLEFIKQNPTVGLENVDFGVRY